MSHKTQVTTVSVSPYNSKSNVSPTRNFPRKTSTFWCNLTNMSADLIEGLEDSRGVELSLTMKASGNAYLYLADEYFHLPPTQEGIKAAEEIIEALKTWLEQVKRLDG